MTTFIQNVWCLLIILTMIIYRSTGESTQCACYTIECDNLTQIEVPIDDTNYYTIKGIELYFKYNPRIDFMFQMGDLPLIANFYGNMIHFKGVAYKHPDYIIDDNYTPELIIIDINTTVTGLASFRKLENSEYSIESLSECRIFVLNTSINSMHVEPFLDNITESIIIHTQNCIKHYVCKGRGIKSILKNVKNQKIQWTINQQVDEIISGALEYMRKSSVDDIEFTTLGRQVQKTQPPLFQRMALYANAGIFSFEAHRASNYLARLEDAFLIKQGNIYNISTTLEFYGATLRYEEYWIQFDSVKEPATEGTMVATIPKFSIDILLHLDFTNGTCSITWEHIKVSDYEKLLITFTGLATNLISKTEVEDGIRTYWIALYNEVVGAHLKNHANKYLNKYICKKDA